MERHKELQYNNKRDECIFVQFNVKLPTITTMFLKAKKERERGKRRTNAKCIFIIIEPQASKRNEPTFLSRLIQWQRKCVA